LGSADAPLAELGSGPFPAAVLPPSAALELVAGAVALGETVAVDERAPASPFAAAIPASLAAAPVAEGADAASAGEPPSGAPLPAVAALFKEQASITL
jgi:hypothetical protein